MDHDEPSAVSQKSSEPWGCEEMRDCFTTCHGKACADFFGCVDHWGHPTCRLCGGDMVKGKAIMPSVSGFSDFGSGEEVTMSEYGGAVLVSCLKCSECGRSRLI